MVWAPAVRRVRLAHPTPPTPFAVPEGVNVPATVPSIRH